MQELLYGCYKFLVNAMAADVRGQGISSIGIDIFLPKYPSLGTRRVEF